VATLWFNVSNHPPEQPADASGCMSSDNGPGRAKVRIRARVRARVRVRVEVISG